jgi:hypothetical protein
MPQVETIIAAMDGEGRWVEDGLIQSATFIDHLGTLAQFVAATEKEEIPDGWRF